MTRKEELEIIIDNLRSKLSSIISQSKDKSVATFVSSYRSINDLNDQLNKYVQEYRSL